MWSIATKYLNSTNQHFRSKTVKQLCQMRKKDCLSQVMTWNLRVSAKEELIDKEAFSSI